MQFGCLFFFCFVFVLGALSFALSLQLAPHTIPYLQLGVRKSDN